MSRMLEGVFVLGCALVGLGIDAKDGTVMQDAVKCSVQLIANVHDHIAANATRIGAGLARVPHIRVE